MNMAILQVRDLDDNLYNSLKSLAKRKKRSVSQEVIKIIENYLSQPNELKADATEIFLNLEWTGNPDENAESIIKSIRKNRTEGSDRFTGIKNVFD